MRPARRETDGNSRSGSSHGLRSGAMSLKGLSQRIGAGASSARPSPSCCGWVAEAWTLMKPSLRRSRHKRSRPSGTASRLLRGGGWLACLGGLTPHRPYGDWMLICGKYCRANPAFRYCTRVVAKHPKARLAASRPQARCCWACCSPAPPLHTCCCGPRECGYCAVPAVNESERPVRPLPGDALPVQAACAALALPPDLAIIVSFSSVAFSSARVSSSSGSASLYPSCLASAAIVP